LLVVVWFTLIRHRMTPWFWILGGALALSNLVGQMVLNRRHGQTARRNRRVDDLPSPMRADESSSVLPATAAGVLPAEITAKVERRQRSEDVRP